MNNLTRLERLLGPLPQKSETKKSDGIEGLPEGNWIHKGVYLITKTFPLPYRHGDVLLEKISQSALTLEPWGVKGIPVFLDLETTGLAGGSGTYAFLAGLAYPSGTHLVAKQIFLATPASEELWLKALFENFPGDRVSLVTYNGKTFDWPIIQTRSVLNRKKLPVDVLGHLDLLQLVRYLWKGKLENCRLATVETQLLKVKRTITDVPGWLVPRHYADFLKTGNARPLQGVFYHNLMDILSLVALKLKIAKLMGGSELVDPEDTLKAGELWASKKKMKEAEKLWSAVASYDCPWSYKAKLKLAYEEKRRQNYEKATSLFEECATVIKGPILIDVLIELAKINEHHFKDLPKAFEFTKSALIILDRSRPFYEHDSWKKLRFSIVHRLKRLTGKLNRQKGII